MRTTPETIETLEHGEIFVFGSNQSGQHSGGAAAIAHGSLGAIWGVGEGMTGRCYAFPTLTGGYRRRTMEELFVSAVIFKATARSMPELTFLLTKVGCGIAGYAEEDMKKLFEGCPANVVKPEGW